MKSFLLLALFAAAAFAVPSLNTGLYSYTTEVAGAAPLTVSASAIVKYVSRDDDSTTTTYALRVADIVVVTGDDKIVKDDTTFVLPFQFVRADNGQIVSIKVHPEENLEAKNLKKSIAESFQSSFEQHKDHVVVETGANGVRNVHYKMIHSDSVSVGIRGSYSEKDFISYPQHSNMENGGFGISSKKVSTFDSRDHTFKSALITTEIMKTEEITTLTKTRIEFATSEVFTIDMIDEVEWEIETLEHEIDLRNRVNRLKARLPSVNTLIQQADLSHTPNKQALKARAQLVSLANMCSESAEKAVKILREMLTNGNAADYGRVANLLARFNSQQAQLLLADQISENPKDTQKLTALFTAMVALNQPKAPEVLTMALLNLEVSEELQAMYELTVGTVAKFLNPAEAEYILAPYVKELETAVSSRQVQLLHVLGNAGTNAPVDVIVAYLSNDAIPVRAAALVNLRNFLQQDDVQAAVMQALKQKENTQSKPFVSSLITTLKESMKKTSLSNNLVSFLNQVADSDAGMLGKFLRENSLHQSFTPFNDVQSSTTIWNDTSDLNYNLVAPAAQRQRDVDNYPIYTAQLNARQLGPRPSNLKAATGIFSGSNGGCLADNFKIFDKLIMEINLLGDTTTLGDVQLYAYTLDNIFDSRIYAIINGNTLIDFELHADNCTEQEVVIYNGELEIFNYETEIPIDMGTVLLYGVALAHLEFDAGYTVCLQSSFLELYIVGKTDFAVDIGATITALGVVRVGVEGDIFVNYILGPDTHIGSPNSTASMFASKYLKKEVAKKEVRTCETCIGLYYGHDQQIVYVGLFIQRREGLGWGEPVRIPIIEDLTPAVPFPTPISERCDMWEFPTLPKV